MTTPVQVGPRTNDPTHHISLSDGIRVYGLVLEGGPKGVREVPQTPSTLKVSGGGGKFGDWEPGMSHIEQRTWEGGRGQENFDQDDTRFFDSQNCWTMTPNKLLPGPQLSYGRNVFEDYVHLPVSTNYGHNDMRWVPLVGARRFLAVVSNRDTFTADKVRLWIRRVGSPGTLTYTLRTDSASLPTTTVLQTVTKTVSDVPDFLSVFMTFDWSGTQSMTASTNYWHSLAGASTDNQINHWEVAVNPDLDSNTAQSTDGTTWAASTAGYPYILMLSTTTDRVFIPFILDGMNYAVTRYLNGSTASELYINGARGKATSATSTSLTDTNVSIGTATYQGAVIKIINGTGVGQTRTISSNTSTAFTVPTWDITPDTTSEYIIYNTWNWHSIASHGITAGKVTSVAVTGNLPGVARFAQGSATNIRRMRFNAAAATPAHEFADDGTNKADLLYTFYDEASKTSQVWRALNGTTVQISRATTQAWGTDLTFGTGIPVGSTQFAITGMTDYNGDLYVGKEDSLWKVVDDVPSRIPVGLASSPHPNNGIAMRVVGFFLYFSYMHSVERLYGTTLDDVGPWQGSGIPAGRTGVVSAMTSAFNWLFVAVDAGSSGTSCVLCYDGRGYHEVFRAFETGQRIRSIWWQPNQDGKSKLWIECGGSLWYIDFPQNTLNPLNDSTFRYHHEGVLITSTIDMGTARLPKLFKELDVLSKNLASGIYIEVDYQVDNDIGGTTWTNMGQAFMSPESTVDIFLGNVRQIRFRLRLVTGVAETPAIIAATVAEGYARTPLKYQYLLRLRTGDNKFTLRGDQDHDPDELVRWLKEAAAGAKKIMMRSLWEQFDRKIVIVEPIALDRTVTDTIEGAWAAIGSITLREV